MEKVDEERSQIPRTNYDNSPLQIRFPSVSELVPAVCHLVTAFVGNLSTGESTKLIMILRELLENALEHGNRNDPSLQITCEIHWPEANSIEVAVSDEGEGFSMDTIDLKNPDSPTEIRRRGLRLVDALSDSLELKDCGRSVICRLAWHPVGATEESTRQYTLTGERKENGL